jgi:hypothetical protein
VSPLANFAIDDKRASGPHEVCAQLVEGEIDRARDSTPSVFLGAPDDERRPG